MSDTCIVCLGKLGENANDITNSEAPEDSSIDNDANAARIPSHSEDEMIANLQPCGHKLHNECLKPWVERANSCPICRRSFNLVELSVRVGGTWQNIYPIQYLITNIASPQVLLPPLTLSTIEPK